jgi:superoxide dismutase, Fe-Mn family
MQYKAREFDIPELTGISKTTMDEHLKLYAGYVNNTNKILEDLKSDSIDAYAKSEMQRRLGFEFDGMRNHEFYFASLERGSKAIPDDSDLRDAIEKEWGSFDVWLNSFKALAKTRGVGWAILYYDKHGERLINAWVDEQHLGHLTGLDPIIALDMWEHSFVADYQPSGKGQYIEDYFTNLNWHEIEDNFKKARGKEIFS